MYNSKLSENELKFVKDAFNPFAYKTTTGLSALFLLFDIVGGFSLLIVTGAMPMSIKNKL